MATEKKLLSACTWALYDGGADGSKRWFLYTTSAPRKKDYAGLGKIKDPLLRRARAEALLAERNTGPEPGKASMAQLYADAAQTVRLKSINARLRAAQVWEKEMKAAGLWYSTVTLDFAKSFVARYTGYIYAARGCMKLAIKHRQATENPFEGLNISRIRRPHLPAARIPSAATEMLWQQLKEQDPKVWMMARILHYCFIRQAEQVRISVEDIHLEEGYITVYGGDAKNGKTQAVRIPAPLLPDLKEWLSVPGQQWLFQKSTGKPYTSPQVFRAKHQLIVKGLKGLPARTKLYSWKHTGVCGALVAKIPAKQIQLQLRHCDMKQLQIYSSQMALEDMDDIAAGW